ncbi:MAG: glycosyltransferase, partial [Candidatus Neomarinimicrobiota bacterium]
MGSLVGSIQAQIIPHDRFEMIIVDDGSQDDTEIVVRELKASVDFELRYLSQENMGPGAARNLGMNHARGDLFLFTDSDCEPDPEWAKRIHDQYVAEEFDACGGPDASKQDFTPLQRAIDFSMTSFLTTGGLRGHGSRALARFYPRSHNMGMTRRLYEKVGGFGSLRHGQDIELSHRIIKSGARVIHIPDAVVYHRRRTSLMRFFRQ